MVVRVYGASKLRHADLWKRLRDEWHCKFVMRWVDFITYEEANSDDTDKSRIVEGWLANIEDVYKCDVVLVYGDDDDNLRGALVEAGMGIAFGKTVIVVGDNPAYGTWQYLPQVQRIPTLDLAREFLKGMEYQP